MKIPTVGIPAYPKEIESFWWRKSTERWPDAGEQKVLNLLRTEIVKQSDLFNKQRSFSPSSYGSRDTSILAYGNFFFPRTWRQLEFVLTEILDFREWGFPRQGVLRILDLGSGSGAAGLSALHLLRKKDIEIPLELKAVDYSGKSLSLMRNLHRDMRDLWTSTKLSTERRDLRSSLSAKNKENYDLIILSSSFNEISSNLELEDAAERILKIVERLKPSGFLIIIEPALRELGNCLHQATALAAERGKIQIHGPYFNGLPCPLPSMDSPYHSHEVRDGLPTETCRKLNSPLGLNLKDLKFSFTALSGKEPSKFEESASVLRIVSPVSKRKGLHFFVGIAADGKEYVYEIQSRDMLKEERKSVELLQRGDVLVIERSQGIGGEQRIRIPNVSAIRTLFAPR